MKRLIELAGRIKDKKLQRLVIKTLRTPGILSNPEFKYKATSLKEVPASLNWHHTGIGGLLEHTYSVTLLSITVAETLEKVYKTELDKDALIAAALLHDFGKLFEMRKEKAGWEGTGVSLDHTMLGTSELYSRGFPEKVMHIIASHFGEQGPTPPQTVEALIFHTLDHLDAVLGTQKQEDILKLLGLG